MLLFRSGKAFFLIFEFVIMLAPDRLYPYHITAKKYFIN